MIYEERSSDLRNEYRIKDVFGTITFTSPIRLEADILDGMTMHVLRTRASAGTINDTIEYTFAPAPTWLENEAEEPAIQ